MEHVFCFDLGSATVKSPIEGELSASLGHKGEIGRGEPRRLDGNGGRVASRKELRGQLGPLGLIWSAYRDDQIKSAGSQESRVHNGD